MEKPAITTRGIRVSLTLRRLLQPSTWDTAERAWLGAAAGGLNCVAYGREGERRRPSAWRCQRRAPPSRAQREPSRVEPSRASPAATDAAAAPRPRRLPPPSPAPRCRPTPLTMPRAPPAPATPQPRSSLSARSCRAAAPGLQVSERDPHAPTRGSPALPFRTLSLSPPPLPARSLTRAPASSPEGLLPCRAIHPSSVPSSILPL